MGTQVTYMYFTHDNVLDKLTYILHYCGKFCKVHVYMYMHVRKVYERKVQSVSSIN